MIFGNDTSHHINTENMFINGTDIGLTIDTCVIPIFLSQTGNPQRWIIGNLFMQSHYMVFDATPYDENGE